MHLQDLPDITITSSAMMILLFIMLVDIIIYPVNSIHPH